jgi:hypothetical protein
MKILISTGIYTPDIGGPAIYARNLYETWKSQGHDVKVAAYRWERAFFPIIRHFLFFLKVIRKGYNADHILVLDTWSAAVPTLFACKIIRKKYTIRTGGDFLWETYIERTNDPVLFRDFYKTRMSTLSFKERLVYRLSKLVLKKAHKIIFSTEWQRDIFIDAYGINKDSTYIVENFCGKKNEQITTEGRLFVAGTRNIRLKNLDLLKESISAARSELLKQGLEDIELDTGKAMMLNFIEKVRCAYAVILISISEVSPNMIFDAIKSGVPFIVTKENGITERIKDCAIFVDPNNKDEIKDKIVWLSNPINHKLQAEKVRKFNWVHTWEDIGREILDICEK